MLKYLKALFRRKPVIVVNAYTVRKTDLQKLREEKHKQLAREMAREDWSVR